MKKILFFLWGAVYWPFMLVGCLFMGLSELFGGIGAWLHDLLVDWSFSPLPDKTSNAAAAPVPAQKLCSCGAYHTGPCLPGRIS